jgi:hypothetical protein
MHQLEGWSSKNTYNNLNFSCELNIVIVDLIEYISHGYFWHEE